MLKYLEKLETMKRSSACAPVVVERGARLAVVGEAEIDLVDDEAAAAPRDGRRRSAPFRRAATCVPVGFDGDAISAPRVRGVQCARSARRSADSAVSGPTGMPTGSPSSTRTKWRLHGYAGIGQQHLVVAVDEERQHEQQRRRRSRGDDHALGGDGDAEVFARSARRSPPAAPAGPAPTCSRCRRRRARAARHRAREPASESPARRSPCGRRCGPRPRARAPPSAPPSRGTGAMSATRAARGKAGLHRKGILRRAVKSVW